MSIIGRSHHALRIHRSLRAISAGLRPRSYATAIPDYIAILLRNPELSQRDASNELRWIMQAVRDGTSIVTSSGKQREQGVRELVERRGRGEPLQYILGNTDFGPLTLLTRPPTLIPRPETAFITSLVAQKIFDDPSFRATTAAPLQILDLCSGSGCISLLLAHHLGDKATIKGIDISQEAISLSRDNVRHLGMKEENVSFELGDLWSENFIRNLYGGDGKFDMIISNPPYIPRSEYDGLSASVKAYEDPLALVGDPEDVPNQGTREAAGQRGDGRGLAFYRRIAKLAPDLLSSQDQLATKGWKGLPRVAVEVGVGQARDVENILRESSGGAIVRTEIWKDQYEVDRVVVVY